MRLWTLLVIIPFCASSPLLTGEFETLRLLRTRFEDVNIYIFKVLKSSWETRVSILP